MQPENGICVRQPGVAVSEYLAILEGGVGPAVEMFTHVNVRLGVFMICAIMRICILNAPLKGWDTHNALKGAYVFLGSSCA